MAVSKNTTTLPARSEPGTYPRINIDSLPERYAMGCAGSCLEPQIADGTMLLFDKTAPYAPGDLVVLYRRPELLKPGQSQGMVKRLVMAPPPWVKFPYAEHPESELAAMMVVEQLNPPKQLWVPCADLVAVHRCLGPMPEGMKTYRAGMDDLLPAAAGSR